MRVGAVACRGASSKLRGKRVLLVLRSSSPQWQLMVCPTSGWGVNWVVPMYIVVVVISLVLSLLLMALMASR